MKTHYELLGVAPNAPAEQIKAAFRGEVARYHPDKVAHLGPELQALAAQRTAELTVAYNVLSREDRRADYDAQLQQLAAAKAASASPAPTSDAAPPTPPDDTAEAAPAARPRPAAPDMFLKRASIAHLREALSAGDAEAVEFSAVGFDLAVRIKPKRAFFQKPSPPLNLVARVAATVDPTAVEEAWTLASRVPGEPGSTLCVMVLGSGMASAGDLGGVIARERRRRRPSSATIVLAPVDVRDWHALVPADAPPAFKALLERLRGA